MKAFLQKDFFVCHARGNWIRIRNSLVHYWVLLVSSPARKTCLLIYNCHHIYYTHLFYLPLKNTKYFSRQEGITVLGELLSYLSEQKPDEQKKKKIQ